MVQTRVVIVGAGPAGVRCAETLVKAGLRPLVIDEGQRDGGQVYRRQPENFTRSYKTLYGTEAGRAESLHRTFDALRGKIDYRPETLAWNISEGHLHLSVNNRTSSLAYDRLILCTGATDRLMPVKGWHLAGAYSLGAAQIALKSQACSIGRKVVFMGTGPLLYLVASQYIKAGAQVAAVLDTASTLDQLKALPNLMARPMLLKKGIALVNAIKRAGVPVLKHIEPVEILGQAQAGVRGVRYRQHNGEALELDCDAVAVGYHLRAETQLADLARCEFVFEPASRQWLPKIDVDGRSSVAGVYLAGDGVRILGADAAEIAGRLAALALLKDLGRDIEPGQLNALRKQQERMDRFRRGLARAFPWPAQQTARIPDDAFVCRCESVSVGELRRVVSETGAAESNRAKAFSRVGMGRCQGRYCGHAGAEIIADAAGIGVSDVGRLRAQAPVKPLSIKTTEDEA